MGVCSVVNISMTGCHAPNCTTQIQYSGAVDIELPVRKRSQGMPQIHTLSKITVDTFVTIDTIPNKK